MTFAFGAQWQSRDAAGRGDAATQRAALANPATRVLPLWRGKPQQKGDALAWVAPDHPMLSHAPRPWLYLGRHEGQAAYAADISTWEPDGLDSAALAMFFDDSIQSHPKAAPGAHFADLRRIMATLPLVEAALAATARALFNWHRTHRFCAACGHASEVVMAGWERTCPSCAAKHFPRTDPVVIMLVTHGNSVLLGRSHGWPERMYSALAGFIEPGESFEAAVAREVVEETGITLGAVRYVASQPWPFPNSLMLGAFAEAQGREITLDDELEDARWFTREEVLRAWTGEHPDMLPARRGAIAHALIGDWLAGRLSWA